MKIALDKQIGIEPVTPESLADYLRIDSFDKNELTGLIRQGRESVENYTRIDFVEKVYKVYFDLVPSEFVVPFLNFQTIKAVTFTKSDGTTQVVTENFKAYPHSRIILLKTIFDASEIDEMDGLCFELVAGLPTAKIPEKIQGAIKWYAINTYFKTPASDWYPQFKDLIREYRVVTA